MLKNNYPYFNRENIKFWPKDNPNWGNIEMGVGSASVSSEKIEKDVSNEKSKEKEKEEDK